MSKINNNHFELSFGDPAFALFTENANFTSNSNPTDFETSTQNLNFPAIPDSQFTGIINSNKPDAQKSYFSSPQEPIFPKSVNQNNSNFLGVIGQNIPDTKNSNLSLQGQVTFLDIQGPKEIHSQSQNILRLQDQKALEIYGPKNSGGKNSNLSALQTQNNVDMNGPINNILVNQKLNPPALQANNGQINQTENPFQDIDLSKISNTENLINNIQMLVDSVNNYTNSTKDLKDAINNSLIEQRKFNIDFINTTDKMANGIERMFKGIENMTKEQGLFNKNMENFTQKFAYGLEKIGADQNNLLTLMIQLISNQNKLIENMKKNN